MDWIKEQWNWLKSFFSEPSGKASIKRLIMFWIVVSFLTAYFKIALATNTIVDIPMNWSFLLSAILGLGILDKYVDLKK